jgi:hypothetical protein
VEAKNLQIYKEIPAKDNDLTLEIIAHRIFLQRQAYLDKFAKKNKSEADYYNKKTFVEEASPANKK